MANDPVKEAADSAIRAMEQGKAPGWQEPPVADVAKYTLAQRASLAYSQAAAAGEQLRKSLADKHRKAREARRIRNQVPEVKDGRPPPGLGPDALDRFEPAPPKGDQA